MSDNILDSVVIEPSVPANAAVIWLHGLGADGHDFAPLAKEFAAQLPAVRFIFPHAPQRAVTINGGVRMRAWFDISHASLDYEQDEVGIVNSAGHIERIISLQLESGIAANRIVLAGFSQGGAIALHVGLRYPLALAGLLALSSYLPLSAKLEAQAHSANKSTQIFMAHGSADALIPIQIAERAQQQLRAMHYPLSWKVYPMEHQVCPAEVVDIRQWLMHYLK